LFDYFFFKFINLFILPPRPPAHSEARTLAAVRMIKNFDDIVNNINMLKNVKLTIKDLSLLTYQDQVSLIMSSNIFISMHGAALGHMFYMSLGTAYGSLTFCSTYIILFLFPNIFLLIRLY